MVKLDVSAPEGFEATGEYRAALYGEHYYVLSGGAEKVEYECATTSPVIVLRKLESCVSPAS